MKPANETALVIDFKSEKICVSVLKKNWKIIRENSEKRIT